METLEFSQMRKWIWLTDFLEFAERKCSDDGRWEDGPGTAANPSLEGYTNYSNCYRPEIFDLMNRLHDNNNTDSIMIVAQTTRLLELTGLSVSLFSLIISLLIFTQFRCQLKDFCREI